MGVQPRPGILDVAAYVGGESKAEATRGIRLASNENPLGCSPAAREAYRMLGSDLHRYPDGGTAALRKALADRYGLEAERIVATAGSDELIALLVRAYAGPGDEVLYSAHGFLMYAISARTAGATAVAAPEVGLRADVDALLERVNDRTRLLFLANPNNPTGSYLPAAEIERLHGALPPHVLLVIDAAYAEYVTAADYSDHFDLVRHSDNVVVMRTFSKIHGLAALRIGWGYMPAAVADVLNRVRGPFNVSAAGQAAAVAALDDEAFVRRSREENERVRALFVADLHRLNLRAEPSVGNFVLVAVGDAAGAAAHLKDRGILVRQMQAYGLPEHLRITVGTQEDMAAVVAALADWQR